MLASCPLRKCEVGQHLDEVHHFVSSTASRLWPFGQEIPSFPLVPAMLLCLCWVSRTSTIINILNGVVLFCNVHWWLAYFLCAFVADQATQAYMVVVCMVLPGHGQRKDCSCRISGGSRWLVAQASWDRRMHGTMLSA